VVASRYDSALTGLQLKDLAFFKEKIFDEIKDIAGSLIVKEYPTKTASVQTIRNHIERMRSRGQEPDMIIVDYADLMKPGGNPKDEKRHQLEGIYEDLRGLAQIHACPIWTASQTNRSGLNAEIITMESISEAFNKCFVADLIFSVSRTIRDRAVNGGRIFIAKNRNGPDGLIYNLLMDTSCVKVKVLPKGVEMEESSNNHSQQQMSTLKEKYKNFRKERQNENRE
jgi:replicative DNA helicase